VLCYTVNDAAHAHRLRQLGVASIITDRPAEIGAALASGG
jgi:glycerophosphoryl diester phosphodiesterase